MQTRKTRSKGFFGLHLDFHANPELKDIGKNVTPEMVDFIIEVMQPDYIQCDNKGHHGYCSYPTTLGNATPHLTGDPLKVYAEGAHRHGLPIIMHYSGVIDRRVCRVRPEWAVVDAEGERSKHRISLFGPYLEELLIPQFQEMIERYDIDGVWLDGDCWGTRQDYSEAAIAAFREETGISDVPRQPDDPHWLEFMNFHREAYRNYVRRYISAMRELKPEFQFCIPGAYTTKMPEPVVLDVDWLSEDTSGTLNRRNKSLMYQSDVNYGRIEARMFALTGKPWDLMPWSHAESGTSGSNNTLKTVTQLCQEGAVGLMLGGGCMPYSTNRRDGSVYRRDIRKLGQLGQFCRAREELCHWAEIVPQIGLIVSTTDCYRRYSQPFGSAGGGKDVFAPFKGMCIGLLKLQQSVDFCMEHQLEQRAADYPLLVLPEWRAIDETARDRLLTYVKDGGTLLLVGPRAAALFVQELDVEPQGEPEFESNGIEYKGTMHDVRSVSQKVAPGKSAQPFGSYFAKYSHPFKPIGDYPENERVAATITPLGKGRIAATWLELGDALYRHRVSAALRFLGDLVQELFPDPIVTVTGSQYVDVSLMRKDGKLMVNLLNTAGDHENVWVDTFDEIPPLGPLQVSIRCDEEPAQVWHEPVHESLEFEYRDGAVHLTLPRLEIHSIIALGEQG